MQFSSIAESKSLACFCAAAVGDVIYSNFNIIFNYLIICDFHSIKIYYINFSNINLIEKSKLIIPDKRFENNLLCLKLYKINIWKEVLTKYFSININY